MLKFCIILLLPLLALPVTAAEPEAQPGDVDFSNLAVEFIVPFMPAGGTDTWARSVLPFLGHYLPGQPEIVIKNVAGSNGTKAANDYAGRNPLDGQSLLVTGASSHLAYLLGDERARYDFSRWRALMAYSSGIVVYTSPQMGVKNIWELLAKPDQHLMMASIGPASEDLFVLLAFDILGLDLSSIFGVRGRSSARQWYERGDANIDFQTTAAYMAYVKPQADAGQAVPLFSLGAFDRDMNYIRDPMFPELPNLAEVYERLHGHPPAGDGWDAWLSLYRSGLGSLKLVVVPKQTPEPIIAAYKQAIEQLQGDAEFIEAVSGQVGSYGIIGMEKAESLLQKRTNLPAEKRQWLIDWIFRKYQVRM